jgi:hypothetical protein
MALPITIPNTFATETTNIPLSDLDANFTTVASAINGIGSGSEALANVVITGGTITNVTANAVSISNATITGGTITGITPIAVVVGGTGSNTAAGARTNLGAAASGSNSDITALSGLTTALSVVQGGTGQANLTANSVLIGNGTSAINLVAPGTSGNVLTSNGTTWTSTVPSVALSSFTSTNQSLTSSGFQKLPGGVIMQWGIQNSIPADGGVDITFPTAFPTAVGSITATFTGSGTDTSPDFGVHTRNVSTTGFRLSNADQNAVRNAYWFAIGY